MSEMLEDIVREMRESMGWPNPDGRPLTARVQDYIFKMYADRIEAAAKKMADENVRLRATLKPVLECDTDFDICGALEEGDIDTVTAPFDAVSTAKRIYKESEVAK